MKTFISFIVAIVVFWLFFFKLDPWIVNSIVNAVPASAEEWKGLIKIITWGVVIFFTGGLGFWLSFGSGFITRAILAIFR